MMADLDACALPVQQDHRLVGISPTEISRFVRSRKANHLGRLARSDESRASLLLR